MTDRQVARSVSESMSVQAITEAALSAPEAPPLTSEWRMCDEWNGIVALNGDTVTTRCRGVLYEEGQPVAVELYRLNEHGAFFVDDSGEVVTEIVRGTVIATLARRQALA